MFFVGLNFGAIFTSEAIVGCSQIISAYTSMFFHNKNTSSQIFPCFKFCLIGSALFGFTQNSVGSLNSNQELWYIICYFIYFLSKYFISLSNISAKSFFYTISSSEVSMGFHACPNLTSLNSAARPVICLRRSISSLSIPRCLEIHASLCPNS